MPAPETTVVLAQPLATSSPWEFVGLSRSNWNRLRAAGKTPPPISLCPGRPTWRVKDLETWLEKMPARERKTKRGGNHRQQKADAS